MSNQRKSPRGKSEGATAHNGKSPNGKATKGKAAVKKELKKKTVAAGIEGAGLREEATRVASSSAPATRQTAPAAPKPAEPKPAAVSAKPATPPKPASPKPVASKPAPAASKPAAAVEKRPPAVPKPALKPSAPRHLLGGAVDTFQRTFEAAGQGTVAVNCKLLDFARTNVNSSLDYVKDLAAARSPVRVMRLQMEYWHDCFETFVSQTQELRALSAEVVANANKPLREHIRGPRRAA
jgi:hypothetical protein